MDIIHLPFSKMENLNRFLFLIFLFAFSTVFTSGTTVPDDPIPTNCYWISEGSVNCAGIPNYQITNELVVNFT